MDAPIDLSIPKDQISVVLTEAEIFAYSAMFRSMDYQTLSVGKFASLYKVFQTFISGSMEHMESYPENRSKIMKLLAETFPQIPEKIVKKTGATQPLPPWLDRLTAILEQHLKEVSLSEDSCPRIVVFSVISFLMFTFDDAWILDKKNSSFLKLLSQLSVVELQIHLMEFLHKKSQESLQYLWPIFMILEKLLKALLNFVNETLKTMPVIDPDLLSKFNTASANSTTILLQFFIDARQENCWQDINKDMRKVFCRFVLLFLAEGFELIDLNLSQNSLHLILHFISVHLASDDSELLSLVYPVLVVLQQKSVHDKQFREFFDWAVKKNLEFRQCVYNFRPRNKKDEDLKTKVFSILNDI